MPPASLFRFTVASLVALTSLVARAESVLDHLPEDAIGFALVRSVSATSAKIERVAKIFENLSPQPIPAPWPLIKATTGLGAGLDEQGEALLAFLPGSEGLSDPRMLLLVPVHDYVAFAGSISADATGEICPVTIAGEEVLVAHRGGYAALMNVEHRTQLEQLLASTPRRPDALAPLADWLNRVDVAAVLTPNGVELLTAAGKAGLDGQRAAAEGQLGDPQFADQLRLAQQTFDMYDTVLQYLGAKTTAAAAGLAIDDQANVKLVSQVLLAKDGDLADAPTTPPAERSPFAGIADQDFVFAAGGPFPQGYADAMSKFTRRMIEQFPGAYGFDKFADEDWKELEAAWRDAMKGLRSMSVAMLPGEDDDPLYSNVFGVLTVDDSEAYLKAYAESMKKWNDLLAKTSSDIKIQYQTSDVEIAGKRGILLSSNVAEAAADPNVPGVQMMMKAMFGEDGVLRIYLVAAEKQKIVMAMSDEPGVAAAVAASLQADQGLAASNLTKKAVKLLDPQAPWLALVSPKGCVAWFTRLYKLILANFAGGVQGPDIPEFPETPPVGMSLNLGDGRVSGEMAWSVETLEGLARYIKKCQDAF
jgi:hypothetical protein